MKGLLFLFPVAVISCFCNAQNVGIGTTTPNANALLHVHIGASATSGILFSGSSVGGATVPDLGAGTRLMFYPGIGAFRAGTVTGTQWDDVNVGKYSIALGFNAIASAYSSTAMGDGTLASGVGATALGLSSEASGIGSIAMGENTTSSGTLSFAMGNQTTSNGYGSVAFGSFSDATGELATAMGHQTTASAPNSTALGSLSWASGNTATAMGLLTSASGNYSTVMGMFNHAKGFASTVIGMYNDSILATNQTSIAETTPLFIIGNGSNSVRSNAMVVLKNGNVGIGTNAPTEKLVLNAANATLQLQTGGVDKGFVQLSGDNLRLGTYAANDLGNVIFRLNSGDRFTIFPTGNATLTGTLTQNSDERFKQDITPIDNALDKVMQLNGYEYYWKPELQRDDALQIGLIAQNVEKVLPQLVVTDKEGVKSVAYQNMVPVLIEAMKMQQQQIQKLELKIQELTSAGK